MSQRPVYGPDGAFLGSVESSKMSGECKHPRDRWKDVGGCSTGCCDDYRCMDCGEEFRIEVPD